MRLETCRLWVESRRTSVLALKLDRVLRSGKQHNWLEYPQDKRDGSIDTKSIKRERRVKQKVDASTRAYTLIVVIIT